MGNSLSEINPSFKALLANAYAEMFSLPQSELFKIFYAALTEAAGLSANTPENSVHELSQMVSDTKTESQLQFLEFIDATVNPPISSTIQNKIEGYYISKQINELLQQGGNQDDKSQKLAALIPPMHYGVLTIHIPPTCRGLSAASSRCPN